VSPEIVDKKHTLSVVEIAVTKSILSDTWGRKAGIGDKEGLTTSII